MTSQLAEKIIAYRRELHQNPELSNHEFATTARLTRWLEEAGIRILPLGLKTGVVAEIGSGKGPIIALRGDIDALPIEEISGVPFSSQNSGVMHACGHDFHTSVMLGAAHLLKAREATLPGTVRIFFQPAEETFNGAQHLIDAGALDNVAAVFGLHNAPELPTGTFATRAGPFYANVDRFQILITGKGAHAAKPEQGVDTIVTASQIVTALQTLAGRATGGHQRPTLGSVQQNRRGRSGLPGGRSRVTNGWRRLRALSASCPGRVRQHRFGKRVRPAPSTFQSG